MDELVKAILDKTPKSTSGDSSSSNIVVFAIFIVFVLVAL